jgi:hypothetical protein
MQQPPERQIHRRTTKPGERDSVQGLESREGTSLHSPVSVVRCGGVRFCQ